MFFFIHGNNITQEKKLKNWYIQEYTTGTTFEQKYLKTFEKISDDDDDGFQQQSPQRLVDKYKHTRIRNDRLRMRWKLIQAEYYSIENQRS